MAAVALRLVQDGVNVPKDVPAEAVGEQDRGGAVLGLVAVADLAGRLREGKPPLTFGRIG